MIIRVYLVLFLVRRPLIVHVIAIAKFDQGGFMTRLSYHIFVKRVVEDLEFCCTALENLIKWKHTK